MSARRPTHKAGSGGLFQMNHALGQNILKSKVVVENIVNFGEPKQGDTVLEIGPGNGNMTDVMLRRGCNVIAIEKDPRMVIELNKRFQRNPQLRIIHADCLTVDLPQFDLCISNIPYNISSAIVFTLLKKPTFRRAVLMVQKEFADRISAKPGTEGWGRLACNTQLYATVQTVMNVSRKNFVPPPKVDSAVITIQPRATQPDVDFEEWDGLVKLCFNRPHKILNASFKKKKVMAMLVQNRESYFAMNGLKCDVDTPTFVANVLKETELGERRPVTLDVVDFLNLLQKFNEGGLHFRGNL